MRRTLGAALALALSAGVARADMTVEQFQRLTAQALTDQALARSLRDYIGGLSEGLGWGAVAGAELSRGKPYYCPPKGTLLTTDEWRALLGDELVSHRELYTAPNIPLGFVAIKALMRAYPCAK